MADRRPLHDDLNTKGNDMDITIIGTGNMARGIATRALAGGKPSRCWAPRAKAQALAGELTVR